MLNCFVRDCWYVAGWSHEIDGDALLSRTLLGESVLLYRRSDGQVAALTDRCAHRGAPLSMGRREGDAIRCMYHGLKFDAGGQCIEVPGQDRVPPNLRVRSYPVVARNKWLWIWIGDPAKADAAAIPDTWSLDSPHWPYRPGYCRYNAPHMLVCDNLLDFSHLGYVHPTTLGGTENIAANRPKVTRADNKVRVERWLINEVPAPFHTRVSRFPDRVDRWHFYDFIVPGILVMHSGVQATGTGAPQGNIRNALEFRSCQAVTAETDKTAHYFYAVPRNFAVDDVEVTETIHADVVAAFNEDRVMIEAQARNLELAPDAALAPIGADAALAQFRRLMSRRYDAQARSRATSNGT